MRRWLGILAGTTAIAAASLVPGARAAAPPPVGAADRCARSSWVAGTVDLCGGALVYRDYVHDDHGARSPLGALTAPQVAPLARSAGSARYPAGAEATADLVALTMRPVGRELEVAFELNALFRPDQTVAALAVDVDPGARTGGGTWPGIGVRSAGWDVVARFDRGDPATNVIRGRIPMPRGDTWRVQAVTAQADGTVMNVAFRGPHERTSFRTGSWFEDEQAAVLETGDVSRFGHTVRVADLRAGVDRPAPPVRGYHQRVYTSRFTLPPGEGMSYDSPAHGRDGDTGQGCEQQYHFFGRYQPYAVYVPERPGPHGVQLVLHGCSAAHASVVDQPGMQRDFGEARNRILVSPLGRGPFGFYADLSERDVLDVLDDVAENHDVDPDLVFAGGYSMGGYGAYRFAQLHPHRFAGAVSWVGFTGDGGNHPGGTYESYDAGAVGNVANLVGNMRNVPVVALYAGADELVHVWTALAMLDRFERAGVPFDWYLHPVAEHLTFALADGWAKEAARTAALRRVHRPVRVTYRYDPELDSPRYAIRHDRAHWATGIRARGAGPADVDLVATRCGRLPVLTRGGEAGVGPAAQPWVARHARPVGTRAVTGADVHGTLTNVRELTVDVRDACLPASGPVSYRVTTDGPATLRLGDGRAVRLPDAGTHAGVLSPAS